MSTHELEIKCRELRQLQALIGAGHSLFNLYGGCDRWTGDEPDDLSKIRQPQASTLTTEYRHRYNGEAR